MKRLLQLAALALVFFMLAFSLGISRTQVLPQEEAYSLPQKALSVLNDGLQLIREATRALPSYIIIGLSYCKETGEQIIEVFRHNRVQEAEEGIAEV